MDYVYHGQLIGDVHIGYIPNPNNMSHQSDDLDEFEAAVLGIVPAQKIASSAPVTEEKTTPLVKLFQERNIRILGTVEEPMFCAADVAKHIGDADYRNTIKKYEPIFSQSMEACDVRGQRRQMLFLSEMGLYRLLLQSKRKEALEFQMFTYDLLKTERKRTVDALQLALKIERTRNEELRRAKSYLQLEQQDLLGAANAARTKVKALTKENAAFRKQRCAEADAKELRLCGRSEAIPGWNC